MPDGYPQPIFLDATVISNFASTSSVEFLVHLLEAPIVVPAVRDEIERGVKHGHEYLTSAVEAFDEGLVLSDVPPEIGGQISVTDLIQGKQKRCGEPLKMTEHSLLTISQHAVSRRS